MCDGVGSGDPLVAVGMLAHGMPAQGLGRQKACETPSLFAFFLLAFH